MLNTPFVSNQIENPQSAWDSRVTVIEVRENGYLFRREHPKSSGETFFLTHDALRNSFWQEYQGEISFEI